MASNTGKAGAIVAPEDSNAMDKLTHAVLDDILYNIVHDLLVKVHRDEKMARANTAAIRVEKLASDASDSSTPDSRPDVRIETDAAIYEDGKVLLKGNPLKTTKEIVCPRCHLPRLLYPTDGKGSRKPDPSGIYCKKHPYIQKPGFDIYGQAWVQAGPGRGKKKKEADKKGESDSGAGTPDQRPANMLSFPSATCSKCKRCILVTRLNNHMGSCIGNSGRNASRAAAQKITNGASSSGHHDSTPPNSQKGTPLPGSAAASPKKRDGDDLDDDDSSEGGHKKKKVKASAPPPTKKVILKTKLASGKKDKAKTGASGLSQEHKLDPADAAESNIEVVTKKQTKVPSPAKKLKLGLGAAKPPLPPSSLAKNGRDPDAESESSGTLSSPPN